MWTFASAQSTSSPLIQIFSVAFIGAPPQSASAALTRISIPPRSALEMGQLRSASGVLLEL